MDTPICVSGHRDGDTALTGAPAAQKPRPAALWLISPSVLEWKNTDIPPLAGPCAHMMCRSQLSTSPCPAALSGLHPSLRKHQHSLPTPPLLTSHSKAARGAPPLSGASRSCAETEPPGTAAAPGPRAGSGAGRASGASHGAGLGLVVWPAAAERAGERCTAVFGSIMLGSAPLGTARRQEMHLRESDLPVTAQLPLGPFLRPYQCGDGAGEGHAGPGGVRGRGEWL